MPADRPAHQRRRCYRRTLWNPESSQRSLVAAGPAESRSGIGKISSPGLSRSSDRTLGKAANLSPTTSGMDRGTNGSRRRHHMGESGHHGLHRNEIRITIVGNDGQQQWFVVLRPPNRHAPRRNDDECILLPVQRVIDTIESLEPRDAFLEVLGILNSTFSAIHHRAHRRSHISERDFFRQNFETTEKLGECNLLV